LSKFEESVVSYKMSSEIIVSEQLDEFNKLFMYLNNIDVQINEEDQTCCSYCVCHL